jgi:hypothetical protein
MTASKYWMIEYSACTDDHGYHDFHLSEEYGLFSTQEAAEQRAKELDDQSYDQYVTKRNERSYKMALTSYENEMAKYKVLTSNGFNMRKPVKPVKSTTEWERPAFRVSDPIEVVA